MNEKWEFRGRHGDLELFFGQTADGRPYKFVNTERRQRIENTYMYPAKVLVDEAFITTVLVDPENFWSGRFLPESIKFEVQELERIGIA